MKKVYSAIDIGTDSIKLVVTEMYKDKLDVLACASVKSKGVKNGFIISPNETLESLKKVFNIVEDKLGVRINKVIACVPSDNAEFMIGEGYSTITRENTIVNGDDIVRALQSSVYNKVAENRELVSVVPIEFTINDEEIVEDPKGLNANKLSVKSVISTVPKKNVYGIITLLDEIGVDVVDICLNSTADYFEFRTEENKSKIGAVVNIGKSKTEVSIVNKNVVIATEIIPMAGKNIDKDISYIYNINDREAILLKEKFGLASKRNASAREIETVETKKGENIKVNQYEISEIINSRIQEILELSKKQINLLTKKEISYIVISGGTTELIDFKVPFESVFGRNYLFTTISEIGVRDNKYSSVMGSIKFYHEKEKLKNKFTSTMSEDVQEELFSIKSTNNINRDSLLGKIYGYFFDN